MRTEDLKKARYNFEHKMLPEMLHSYKSSIINALLDKRGEMFSVYYSMNFPNDDSVFSSEDFTVTPKRVVSGDKMLYIVVADMPKPAYPLECRRIYFCIETSSEITAYYTSELSLLGGYMLCAWTPDGIHLNYGSSKDNAEEEFRQVGKFFLEKIEKK